MDNYKNYQNLGEYDNIQDEEPEDIDPADKVKVYFEEVNAVILEGVKA